MQMELSRFKHLICAVGSEELEFEEFCTLAAQFLIEEDAEQMHNELREAFRLFDKEGDYFIQKREINTFTFPLC